MKEIKESKIRVKREEKKKDFDTLNITMELEKSLSIDKELEKEKKRIQREKKKKIKKSVSAILISILVIVFAYSIFWISDVHRAVSSSERYLKSNSSYAVDTEGGDIKFTPKGSYDTGIIIYPGEKIEPEAYSQISSLLAKYGYKVIVMKYPLNLPAFSFDKAQKLIDEEDIDNWYVLSHTGSTQSAISQASNNKNIKGAILLGDFPRSDDLNLINKPMLSVWGTKDGFFDLAKFESSSKNLPKNSYFYEIEGGNNTNFANIETLKGDNEAIVSADSQKLGTVKKIDEFIKNTQDIN